MQKRWSGLLVLVIIGLTGLRVRAETINWYNIGGSGVNNLTSSGSSMTGDFIFELGVFAGSFVPTQANRTDWATHWRPAQSTSYVPANQRFTSQFTVTPGNSIGEFTLDKQVYVWGFRVAANASEWILFRAEDWKWPAPNEMNPLGINWNAADATAVIGSINGDGYLMKSASVTSWSQWQSVELAGEAQNEPNQDPDKDGVSNLLEFVFGTPPKTAGPPPQTPVALVGGHLQISIPRRIDRMATLNVEVSSDLAQWDSGTAFTEVVSDGLAALIVRDKTAFTPPLTKRFMRLRASLP